MQELGWTASMVAQFERWLAVKRPGVTLREVRYAHGYAEWLALDGAGTLLAAAGIFEDFEALYYHTCLVCGSGVQETFISHEFEDLFSGVCHCCAYENEGDYDQYIAPLHIEVVKPLQIHEVPAVVQAGLQGWPSEASGD